MTNINLPDPVIIWEAEETGDFTSPISTLIVTAMVGSYSIFTRSYKSDPNLGGTDEFAYDLEDAKEKASRDLADRLRKLLGTDL